ncbi:nucleotidyl transferase AbiEii/AbiGii toxin family protein [Patescibacteria group bacterium]|nr:nucleotidyl transferase AbiEii/AbiGii toxin family protein [Patescibacteria group bacterium]
MNNLITGFDKILNFAKDQGLPVNKKRGVLREYLQSRFLVEFYALPRAGKMSFVGGTSLRMLRGLPRFSEDLDFDNLGLSDKEVLELVEKVVDVFERENIQVELKKKLGEGKTYLELRFPKILFDLKISSNEKEKMMIKIDYARYWKCQEVEFKLFSRYGLIEQVVTNKLDQLLVQKLAAYIGRSRTQARDIYDIVWLYSQGAKIDKRFAGGNGISDVLDKAKSKFGGEGVSILMRRRLKPFLFDEKEIGKLDLLGGVLEKL